MPDEELPYQTEKWVYAGRRMGTKDVLYAFYDESNEMLLYGASPKNASVGSIFEVEIQRTIDNAPLRARLVGAKKIGFSDQPEIKDWLLKDGAAITQLRINKLKGDDLKSVVKECLEPFGGMRNRTYAERAAIVAIIIDTLYNEIWT